MTAHRPDIDAIRREAETSVATGNAIADAIHRGNQVRTIIPRLCDYIEAIEAKHTAEIDRLQRASRAWTKSEEARHSARIEAIEVGHMAEKTCIRSDLLNALDAAGIDPAGVMTFADDLKALRVWAHTARKSLAEREAECARLRKVADAARAAQVELGTETSD